MSHRKVCGILGNYGITFQMGSFFNYWLLVSSRLETCGFIFTTHTHAHALIGNFLTEIQVRKKPEYSQFQISASLSLRSLYFISSKFIIWWLPSSKEPLNSQSSSIMTCGYFCSFSWHCLNQFLYSSTFCMFKAVLLGFFSKSVLHLLSLCQIRTTIEFPTHMKSRKVWKGICPSLRNLLSEGQNLGDLLAHAEFTFVIFWRGPLKYYGLQKVWKLTGIQATNRENMHN